MIERQKILLVDDSPTVTKIVSSVLEKELDYDIVAVPSFAEAKKIVEQMGESISLALLDLILADAPEGEIVDYVISKNIPVIVLTGEDSDDVRDYIWSKNVVDYVQKSEMENLEYVCSLIRRLDGNRDIKVMVVEDSRVVRRHISGLLETHQYQIFDASDGKEALEILKEHPDIKLVITDYNMPNMDGFELTTAIRKNYSKNHLSIISLSTQGEDKVSARFLKLGANDFISKPFANEEFFCRVTHNIDLLENVAKLEELNNLKNKFLGMAAHDLRNPLVTIRGFSEVLLDGDSGEINGEQKDFLKRISSSSEHMLDMLSELLDITMIESGKLDLKFTCLSMKKLIERRIIACAVIADKKNIKLIPEYDEVPKINIDLGKIERVLDNYISNAVKYSDSGTNVYISLGKDVDMAVVKVKDEGPGLSPEDMEKLFGEFQKLSTQPTAGEKSIGLGLSIVKKIVEAHGGEVGAESEPGKGSTFFFKIPMEVCND